ncbi:Retinal pigment epithelial membrane-like protein [Dinothrombium tinctorium]|uniref:Retinal pigment epithelial membrane-like protein n=1 Tax=Dinothrombium tinctorium TaxID=1965070 RepID=A0A3S3RUE0_9ACAR|nr:Retinal pigment epithelial membrane-like protein [Dinothrombium tinctorium]RWS06191.1 Retinal pigment epithelial membrane-like protein [Dinothrombium tinctorium]
MDKLLVSVEECVKPIPCVVDGSIPNWVHGSLIRIGPGKWDFDKFTMNHWFDGSAILVKFQIDDGKVFFSTRFLESDAYKRLAVVKKPVFTEFGTRAFPDPCKNLFARFFSQIVPSDLTDNDISNIYQLEDEIYVATESCNIWRIDPKNLESLEKLNLDKLVGVNIASSHPQHSPSEGVTYNLGSSFITGMKYHIVKIPISSDKSQLIDSRPSLYNKASILVTIPSKHTTCFSYCHSFAMSENHIILIEQPLFVNGFKLATCTPKGKALVDCLEWRPDNPARFHVIDKNTGKRLPNLYESKAFFFFHVINAYEENNQIVVDLVAYDDASILEKLELDRLRKNDWDSKSPPTAKRFVLPLEIKICKLDVQTKKVQLWKDTETCFPGEPVFIPRPGATAEDDGVLLSLVLDANPEKPHYLLVMNAQNFAEIARAYVSKSEAQVPTTIHGLFIK